MPTVPLPSEPNLEQLRNQARDLQRAVRAGDKPALELLAEHHPRGVPAEADRSRFALSSAQLAVARHYGFASWARLRRYLEVVAQYGRRPDQVEAAADTAGEFLRLACLNYGDDDDPSRWAAAARLLADHPEIVAGDIHVAAAVAAVGAVRSLLAADPGAARREGGPFAWEPLCYLAYARHDPAVAAAAVLDTARLLLAAGADPNTGYLWHGLPAPFTVLTGVFGQGELGPRRQPRHPHSLALARLLLEAGADPNDSQTLYNRMFEPQDDHLELLFAFGLGRGDGGPWRARLGSAVASPVELVRTQLRRAVTKDIRARVQLLVDHGVDISGRFDDGHTPVELAVVNGNLEIADLLVAHGAPRADLGPVDALVAGALAGDRSQIERLRAIEPGVVDRARMARPGLMVWAAADGRTDSVRLLAELGFDVNARGRGDSPVEQPWQTALHEAASRGGLELAELLLSLGADPDVRDARFDSKPLGWARYFEQPDLVGLLEPVTAPDPDADTRP